MTTSIRDRPTAGPPGDREGGAVDGEAHLPGPPVPAAPRGGREGGAADGEVYDGILVGAGVAGSRLLSHLLAGPGRPGRWLVVERETTRRDHALAFWAAGPSALDPVVERGWTALRVVSADGDERVSRLRAHRYLATRRAALVDAAGAAAGACRGVEVLAGEVEDVVDGPDAAAVRVGARWYHARWVFDSRRPAAAPATVRLVQRFTGWTVEIRGACFDPEVATLFDFRAAQYGAVCFVYVLPSAPGRALVEHVYIGPADGRAPDAEAALRGYLDARVGAPYAIVGRERGGSPLSDARYPRRCGRRVMAIGVRGGRLQPSSGYALARIERDSAAIARSLARYGHPFRLPRARWLYPRLDAILLWVLAREPARAPEIFAALLRRPDRTFRLLDERAGVLDFLWLLVALPTSVFLRATFRWLRATRSSDGGATDAQRSGAGAAG